MNQTSHTSNNLADHLDNLIPPGCHDLPTGDLPDPALQAARRLAGAEHPVMADDRVSELETRLLARVAVPHQRSQRQRRTMQRRQIVHGMQWAVAACAIIVMAAMVAIGATLLDDGSDPHFVTPGDTAHQSSEADGASDTALNTVLPVAQPVIRESHESSIFVVPINP